jgi:hypothetical protein
VSVNKPSDENNTGMAKETEGSPFALSRKSPPSVSSLFVVLYKGTQYNSVTENSRLMLYGEITVVY